MGPGGPGALGPFPPWVRPSPLNYPAEGVCNGSCIAAVMLDHRVELTKLTWLSWDLNINHTASRNSVCFGDHLV